MKEINNNRRKTVNLGSVLYPSAEDFNESSNKAEETSEILEPLVKDESAEFHEQRRYRLRPRRKVSYQEERIFSRSRRSNEGLPYEHYPFSYYKRLSEYFLFQKTSYPRALRKDPHRKDGELQASTYSGACARWPLTSGRASSD